MPGLELKTFSEKSLRAFVVFEINPILTTVNKKLQEFAVSLHPKFPYPPGCWGVKPPQSFSFRGPETQERE
jgi:hypothetical protein